MSGSPERAGRPQRTHQHHVVPESITRGRGRNGANRPLKEYIDNMGFTRKDHEGPLNKSTLSASEHGWNKNHSAYNKMYTREIQDQMEKSEFHDWSRSEQREAYTSFQAEIKHKVDTGQISLAPEPAPAPAPTYYEPEPAPRWEPAPAPAPAPAPSYEPTPSYEPNYEPNYEPTYNEGESGGVQTTSGSIKGLDLQNKETIVVSFPDIPADQSDSAYFQDERNIHSLVTEAALRAFRGECHRLDLERLPDEKIKVVSSKNDVSTNAALILDIELKRIEHRACGWGLLNTAANDEFLGCSSEEYVERLFDRDPFMMLADHRALQMTLPWTIRKTPEKVWNDEQCGNPRLKSRGGYNFHFQVTEANQWGNEVELTTDYVINAHQRNEEEGRQSSVTSNFSKEVIDMKRSGEKCTDNRRHLNDRVAYFDAKPEIREDMDAYKMYTALQALQFAAKEQGLMLSIDNNPQLNTDIKTPNYIPPLLLNSDCNKYVSGGCSASNNEYVYATQMPPKQTDCLRFQLQVFDLQDVSSFFIRREKCSVPRFRLRKSVYSSEINLVRKQEEKDTAWLRLQRLDGVDFFHKIRQQFGGTFSLTRTYKGEYDVLDLYMNVVLGKSDRHLRRMSNQQIKDIFEFRFNDDSFHALADPQLPDYYVDQKEVYKEYVGFTIFCGAFFRCTELIEERGNDVPSYTFPKFVDPSPPEVLIPKAAPKPKQTHPVHPRKERKQKKGFASCFC